MQILFRCLAYGGLVLAWWGMLNYLDFIMADTYAIDRFEKKVCASKVYWGIMVLAVTLIEALIYYRPE